MEFKKFCEEFMRMADTYKNREDDCPFAQRDAADSPYVEDWCSWAIQHPDEAQELLTEWTTNNPLPIYPTFLDIVQDLISEHPELRDVAISDLMHLEVPKEAAERWHLVPVNAGHITSYVKDWL